MVVFFSLTSNSFHSSSITFITCWQSNQTAGSPRWRDSSLPHPPPFTLSIYLICQDRQTVKGCHLSPHPRRRPLPPCPLSFSLSSTDAVMERLWLLFRSSSLDGCECSCQLAEDDSEHDGGVASWLVAAAQHRHYWRKTQRSMWNMHIYCMSHSLQACRQSAGGWKWKNQLMTFYWFKEKHFRLWALQTSTTTPNNYEKGPLIHWDYILWLTPYHTCNPQVKLCIWRPPVAARM